MKVKSFLVLLVVTTALHGADNPKVFEEIKLSFGDAYGANDWGVYLNGERLTETLDEALDRYNDTPILSVLVEASPRFPYSRGRLNQHDLFEDPTVGDRYLTKQGEARKLRFVRAPVTRTEAWDKVKKYIKSKELDMEQQYLNSVEFYSNPENDLYRWKFDYRLKNADGGGIYIFYNLLTDEITHMGVW